jgi:hypothetical protein
MIHIEIRSQIEILKHPFSPLETIKAESLNFIFGSEFQYDPLVGPI